MPPLDRTGPNAEQISYWNEQAGQKWAALQDLIDAQIRPHGLAAMERAGLAGGERVLDVGCGCGDTTVELARRVGPDGGVLGIDISAPMLERARQRAAAAGLAASVAFAHSDAQTHRFAPEFDVLFSRFGVMFFADPPAAFANLRGALRGGGRLAFVCWQGIAHNPWMQVPLAAVLQHLPPLPLPEPGAPGPFAFADPDHVRRILGAAGFDEVTFEAVHMPLSVGGGRGLDETADFALQMGPAARALREAPDPSVVPLARAAVREALEPYCGESGVVMDSAAWIVTAR